MIVYVLTTFTVQFFGFLISRLVDYEWPTLGLMTFLILFRLRPRVADRRPYRRISNPMARLCGRDRAKRRCRAPRLTQSQL
jgi:hypothetical protein